MSLTTSPDLTRALAEAWRRNIATALGQLPPSLASLALASQHTWVAATWDEFQAIVGDREPHGLPHTKGYYHNAWMKLEMVPLGKDHGRQNTAPLDVVSLYATFRQFRLVRYINTTLCKTGHQSCQPDLSIYLGNIDRLPTPGNEVIDLDSYDPPTLVVEIAAHSLSDDLGMKRLLYEQLGVAEYWVVDVAARSLYAFAIAEGRSGRIFQSVVLPGLDLAIVEEALRRTDENDDGAMTRWLIEKFSH